MMKKGIYYLSIAVISLVIMILISPLRSGVVSVFGVEGIYLSSLAGFILYYLFTWWVLYKYSTSLSSSFIIASILAGASILQLVIRIISFESTLITLLDFLIHMSGVFLAYGCYKLQKQYKLLFVVLSLTCGAWLSLSGNEMWLHKLNFGTFTGEIDHKISYNLSFQTRQGDSLSLDKFRNKYLVLDFWYTHCGVCYQDMPEVEALYNAYKNDPQVDVFAVHSRLENEQENHQTGTEILSREGYRIPCLSIDMDSPVLTRMGVDVYPTVLVFDPSSRLVFRGNIKSTRKYLENILK